MFEKSSKSKLQKATRLISPGKLARVYGQKTLKPIKDLSAKKSTSKFPRLRDEEQESEYNHYNRIGGVSVHTLIVHYGEDEWKESGFTEDSSFLDILKLCKKFIDIYSVGFKVLDGDCRPIKNDKDLLVMLREHEGLDVIDIYVELDETTTPLLFKMPEDQPLFSVSSTVGDPKVTNVSILGDNHTSDKIIVHGDVVNGIEEASTVQFFITTSKYFDIETDLVSISECTTNKELQIPTEAVGHFLVAKFTPMSEDGRSGEPRFAITGKRIEDSTPQVKKKKRGKNKNKKIASLKSNCKLQIEFFNNRAVGLNHKYWSRHLGKVIRDKNICPLRLKTWKDLTESNKQHMWCSIKECFTNPNLELYREHTLEHMHVLWTAWRSSLYVEKVKPCKTKTEIVANVPDGMNDDDWKWLVNNKF